jgi:hypothetical protein
MSKVKRSGKSIQYHDQIEKSRGEEPYTFFVDAIRNLLVEHLSICRGELSKSKNPNKSSTTPDSSIPPNELFPQDDTYASFDEQGFVLLTTTEGGGARLTKSARKTLQKIYDAHVERHEKYLKRGGGAKPVVVDKVEAEAATELDDTFVHLVSGSFGNRQGLELFSDMEALCHVVEIWKTIRR